MGLPAGIRRPEQARLRDDGLHHAFLRLSRGSFSGMVYNMQMRKYQ